MPCIRVKKTNNDKVYTFRDDAETEINNFEEYLKKKGVDV